MVGATHLQLGAPHTAKMTNGVIKLCDKNVVDRRLNAWVSVVWTY
jgi:hypothetical protein